VGLFLVWSNSFIAISYLLGGEREAARLEWLSLTAARFLPAAVLAAAYCLLLRPRETWQVVRSHPVRLLFCGFFAVPAYNFALYFGQQHGVPAPVASLTTALVPLFLMVLGSAVLGERLTARQILGFAVALAGMVVIGQAKKTGGVAGSYGLVLLITALAPLSWSLFSVLSKPLTGRVSPLLWTYLVVAVGGLPLVAALPFGAWSRLVALDGPGWLAVAFLTLLCTILGFAVWTWLLRYLPASSLGFTVFLNPPLTTLSKSLLAAALPATFAFAVAPLEWLGGGMALAGLAVAVLKLGRRRTTSARRSSRPTPAGGSD
jgi:drug/metabolite transporter (DMT)-like permease